MPWRKLGSVSQPKKLNGYGQELQIRWCKQRSLGSIYCSVIWEMQCSKACATTILVLGSLTGLFPLCNGIFLNDCNKISHIGQNKDKFLSLHMPLGSLLLICVQNITPLLLSACNNLSQFTQQKQEVWQMLLACIFLVGGSLLGKVM